MGIRVRGMTTAVDTNALLTILYEEEYTIASEDVLPRAYQKGQVAITPSGGVGPRNIS